MQVNAAHFELTLWAGPRPKPHWYVIIPRLPWVAVLLISVFLHKSIDSLPRSFIYLSTTAIPALFRSLLLTREMGLVSLYFFLVFCTTTMGAYQYYNQFKVLEKKVSYVEAISNLDEKIMKAKVLDEKIDTLRGKFTLEFWG